MAYTCFGPNRIASSTEAFFTVEGGWPPGTPEGFDDYCHYLVGWELVNWLGEVVPDCKVEMSFQFGGSQPAWTGIDGKPWVNFPPIFLRLILPKTVLPLGNYTFRFTMECTPWNATALGVGGIQTIEMPLFIAQMPLAVSFTRPPIPGLEQWREKMIQLADRWAAPIMLWPNNDLGEANWFYDVASTYLQIGNYIKNATLYFPAAIQSARAYRRHLTEDLNPPGAAAPWNVFARGLRQMYQATQDPSWMETAKLLVNSGWVAVGGNTHPNYMRETAYAASTWTELEWFNHSNRHLLERAVTYLLSQLNLLCVQQFGKPGTICQPFFFGLASQALIDYYDLVPDPRIPSELAIMTQFIWTQAVNQYNGFVRYDIYDPNTEWHTGLNPLMYNAWGFLYGLTGNDLYRQQGDILFEHQFDDGNSQWGPKQFAQMYCRSIDYVTRWRGSFGASSAPARLETVAAAAHE